MKYCIGCVHLSYADKEMGANSTMTGAWTMEEASMRCGNGHWKVYLVEYGGTPMFDLEKAMETADTCPDFSERPSEQKDGSRS